MSCDFGFVAGPAAEVNLPPQRIEPLPAREPDPPPQRPGPPRLPTSFDPSGGRGGDSPPYRRFGDSRDAPRGAALCPACARPVAWEAIRCVHCGVELEPDYDGSPRRRPPLGGIRRDCDSHRGPMIQNMGNLTLLVGGLSLCTFGIGLLVALPLGITTWMMANGDLEKMRSGEMEPQGKAQTESGRTSAITGMVLSLVFAAGYAVLFLGKFT
jgi:hypothetical protein